MNKNDPIMQDLAQQQMVKFHNILAVLDVESQALLGRAKDKGFRPSQGVMKSIQINNHLSNDDLVWLWSYLEP